jgi:hypothetical protein
MGTTIRAIMVVSHAAWVKAGSLRFLRKGPTPLLNACTKTLMAGMNKINDK